MLYIYKEGYIMKCARCGLSGVGLWRWGMRFKDKKVICFSCARELGFDPWRDCRDSYLLYSYADIKDGLSVYNQRRWAQAAADRATSEASRLGIHPAAFVAADRLDASDMEARIFGVVLDVLQDEGISEPFPVLDRSGDVFLVLTASGVVFMEYKATANIKWIRFPSLTGEKIRIAGAGRIQHLAPDIVSAFKSGSGL